MFVQGVEGRVQDTAAGEARLVETDLRLAFGGRPAGLAQEPGQVAGCGNDRSPELGVAGVLTSGRRCRVQIAARNGT